MLIICFTIHIDRGSAGLALSLSYLTQGRNEVLCEINKIILEQIVCVEFMRRLLCQCAFDRFFVYVLLPYGMAL